MGVAARIFLFDGNIIIVVFTGLMVRVFLEHYRAVTLTSPCRAGKLAGLYRLYTAYFE